MQVTITLKEPSRSQAEKALMDRGLPVSQPFFGPVFEDALQLGHEIPGFLGIVLKDDAETVYFYPLDDIARIKLV